MAERFLPSGLWAPFGPFAQAIVQGQGQIIHLKGQVALDADADVVAPGDMRGQLRQVLRNIRVAANAFGGSLADVISLTQFTTDIDAFSQCLDIRQEFFKPPYPVTTTVQVQRLVRPEFVVEIAAILEIPRDRFRRPGVVQPVPEGA